MNERHHLRIITTSEIKTWRRCRRKHRMRYKLCYRPIAESPALRFGTLCHKGLEAWYDALYDLIAELRRIGSMPADRYVPLLLSDSRRKLLLDSATSAVASESDLYERAKATAMLEAYHRRWIGEAIEPLGVEVTIDASETERGIEAFNPWTGERVDRYRQGGKMDVVVRWYQDDGSFDDYVMEHKTASGDVSAGSIYRQKLVGDSQISIYHAAAKSLGWMTAGVLYDVLVKPDQPKKATPEGKKTRTVAKWKKCPICNARQKKGVEPLAPPHSVEIPPLEEGGEPRTVQCEEDGSNVRRICTDPGGKLYANQREIDETPDEYLVRLRCDLAVDVDAYLMRQPIGRVASEMEEHAKDVHAEAMAIVDGDRDDAYAQRNPDACFDFMRACEYRPVCYGGASLDDVSQFVKVDDPHTELSALKE